MKVLSVLKTAKFWKELVIMTLGMMVAAAAVYYFLIPSKLIVGSISGFSIVLSGVFELMGIHIKISVLILIINVILLLLAYFLIDHEFGAKTVYTALILGPLTELWEKILPYQMLLEEGSNSVMNDPWFDLVCFVLVLSASQALLFSINASTGGLDILAKIVNKYFHFDIGVSVSVAGALICCSAFAINPPRMVIIGLIGTWVNGLVLDHFTVAMHKKKRVCIITEQYELVRKHIIDDMDCGCGLYPLTGGTSGKPRTEIQTILTQDDFSDLMVFLNENNITAIITASNVSELYGFTEGRRGRNHKIKF